LRGSGRFQGGSPRPTRRRKVSIPFIAGQWSLPQARARAEVDSATVFQSPSLRGSGRFADAYQEALLCRNVSIPFIAGQWSLQP